MGKASKSLQMVIDMLASTNKESLTAKENINGQTAAITKVISLRE